MFGPQTCIYYCKTFTKMLKDVGLLIGLKTNKNKGDVELTLSQNSNNNSLKTDKYMTAIPT